MFYLLSVRGGGCFKLTTLGLKNYPPFPTIRKNKLLPLVFLLLQKLFQAKGTIIHMYITLFFLNSLIFCLMSLISTCPAQQQRAISSVRTIFFCPGQKNFCLPAQLGKGTVIKPPCICHFASPKQPYNIQFRIHMKTF